MTKIYKDLKKKSLCAICPENWDSLCIKLKYMIFFVFCVSLINCTKPSKSDGLQGEYICNLYGNDNEMPTKGWILFDVSESDEITGQWRFNSGKYIGSGELLGVKQDSLYFINLHPNFMDNNIFINYKFDKETLTGNWFHVTIAGVSDSGKFHGFQFFGD